MQLLRPIKIIRIIFGPVLPTLHASWKYFSRKRRKLYDLNFPLKNYHQLASSRPIIRELIFHLCRFLPTLKDVFAPDLDLASHKTEWQKLNYWPFLVNKMDFLIVFWWFSPSKVSGWLLDILVRDSSFGLGVRMNLSLGPTRKSVRMAWKMLNKVAWPCLCLIFPLVPVRLLSFSPSYHFSIQQSETSRQFTSQASPTG